jgi:SOS response regulatory protein OraA/RecX
VPTVTSLRAERRGQLAVELDGSPWRSFPVEAVASAGLYVGCELDRERARRLAQAQRRAAAVAAAAAGLRRRALTQQELDERLERRGVRRADRDDAARVLGEAGYLDDARFAVARAASLAERDSGDALIRHDLAARGVGPETVAAALAALPLEAERARNVIRRRGRGAATARRLVSRGFSEDAVEEALADDVACGGDDAVG